MKENIKHDEVQFWNIIIIIEVSGDFESFRLIAWLITCTNITSLVSSNSPINSTISERFESSARL